MQSIADRVKRLRGERYVSWIAPAIIIALGLLVRMVQYRHNFSLWLDEAALAMNVLDRTFVQLLQPLDTNQGAPLAFLLAVKALTKIFGSSETTLRFIPQVSGLLSVPLFFLLAYRLLDSRERLVALVLFSFSPTLIYFAAEFKPYSSDVLFSIVLFLLTIAYFKGSRGILITAAYAIVGAVSIWFSFPCVFLLAGVGLTQFIYALLKHDRREMAGLGVIGLIWAASFAGLYLVSLKDLGQNQMLLDYWKGSFAPFPPRSLAEFKWYPDAFLRMFDTTMNISLKGVAAFCFILGGIAFYRQDRPVFFFTLATFFFLLAASALRRYPFEERMILFLVPFLALLIVKGVAYLSSLLTRHSRSIPLILFSLLLFYPLYTTGFRFFQPYGQEDMKPVLSYIRSSWQEGDLIFVDHAAVPAFTYYARQFQIPGDQYVYGKNARTPDEIANDLGAYRGRGRVWLLFTHVTGDDIPLTLSVLYGMGGEQLQSWQASGAETFLYNLKKPAP